MKHGARSNDVTVMDAQMKPSKEEYVGGMGPIAIQMMNLLHLDQSCSRRLPSLKPYPKACF